MEDFLAFEGISRRFPGVQALKDVSFSVRRGECHAIVGENGAGKSTLGKIAAGILRPDAGRLLLEGRPCRFRSPLDAAAAGIAIVHQELACCPNLSVAENLVLGRMPGRAGFLSRSALERAARRVLRRVGLMDDAPGTDPSPASAAPAPPGHGRIDPWLPMERLSTGQVQLVQIATALGRAARLIIMDEPTSSLSAGEVARLELVLAELRRGGVTVLYVSHRLEEVRRNCDRATVLRDGRRIETFELASATTGEIVRRMIGRPLPEAAAWSAAPSPGAPLLRMVGLCGPGFRDVSLSLHGGEIVGLAGLVGAGRSELARGLFGIDRISAGRLELDGQAVRIRSPRHAIRLGIGLLPEDRQRQGLILSMSCGANLTLVVLRALGLAGFRRQAAEQRLADDMIGRLRIRTPGPDAPIAGLSGGNQQKIALGRWLAARCRMLILDEPARGVDVAAKLEIHDWIRRLAAEGRAVLLISSELPELLTLSSRIVVMRAGRIAGVCERAAATEESLLRLMAGVPEEPPALAGVQTA